MKKISMFMLLFFVMAAFGISTIVTTGCSTISNIAADVTDTTGIGDGIVTEVEALKIQTGVTLALLAYSDDAQIVLHEKFGDILENIDAAEDVSLTDIDGWVTDELASLDSIDDATAALVTGFASLARAKIISTLGLDALIDTAEDYAAQVANYVVGIRAIIQEVYDQTE
jgi:hypothetical protein